MPQGSEQVGHSHWQQGLTHARAQQWPAAARAFGRATRAAPTDRLYWVNLANAQRRAGALPRAVAAAQRCLRLDPRNPIAMRVLGDSLLHMHRYAEATQVFQALEDTGASETDAMMQHACVLQAQQRPGEAAAVLLRALAREPALVRAHALLADACRDQGYKREAVECMKTVLALEPGNLEAMSHLSFEKRHLCDWADWNADLLAIDQALRTLPPDEARVAAVFGMLSLPLSPALQLVAARAESRIFASGAKVLPALKPAARSGKRIRLGWVSFDFREHPVSQLLVEVLEGFDRERFELVLYSSGPDDGGPLRKRMVTLADRFIDLRGLSDPQAAERVRGDGIDVLIDLMGHTRGHRLGIFARRAAPLQVSFLGYPGSTGLEGIDYVIGDACVTPLDAAAHYSEKIAQLPRCFQPNGRGRPLPQPMTRAQAGLPEGAFVLCAFNHTYKILPEAFDCWCAVLRDVPNSVLWLKETNAQLHGNVLREAGRRGIASERVVFAPTVSYAEHFSRLALADLFVDTWPYNAHTTASDALWAGLPVVTVCGETFASRVAASVLHAAGLDELVFTTASAYREAILALAREPGRLAAHRNHLQDRRFELPLFDCPAYTRDLQVLFERMHTRWRDGRACDHLPAMGAGANLQA